MALCRLLEHLFLNLGAAHYLAFGLIVDEYPRLAYVFLEVSGGILPIVAFPVLGTVRIQTSVMSPV